MPAPASPPPASPAAKQGSTTKPKRSRSPRLKPDEQAARQEMILLRTICGEKAKVIAEEMNLAVRTVKSDLAAARRSDMLVAARDRMAMLMPKAIAVLEAYLEDGDKDVALVVLEGLGVIGKHVNVSVGQAPLPPGVETFELFRARVVRGEGGHGQGIETVYQEGSGEICTGVAGSGQIIDAQATPVAG